MPPTTPSPRPQVGEQVEIAAGLDKGQIYTVRAVDGNVLELQYHTGRFARFAHVSSVIVCPPPAAQTAASLPAPAAGQGEGISCSPFRRSGESRCPVVMQEGGGEGSSVDYALLLERIAVLAHSGLCTFHLDVARDRLKEIRELCEPWDLLKHPERRA